MPALMSRFPGPLAISRNELTDPYPKPRDCGPLLRLIAAQRRVALPYVVEEMRSGDSGRRFWATFLLTELAYVEAVPALVARFHDADTKVRGVARAAAPGAYRRGRRAPKPTHSSATAVARIIAP